MIGIVPVASAAVVKLDPTTSFITQSGPDGTVIATFLLEGSFNVSIADTPQHPNRANLSEYYRIDFQNIDVHVTAVVDPVTGAQTLPVNNIAPPPSLLPSYAIISLVTNVFENYSTCNALIGSPCYKDDTSGTFDGTNFTLNRLYATNYPYEDIYTTSMYATVVPLPAAFWLLGSALLFITGLVRRKK